MNFDDIRPGDIIEAREWSVFVVSVNLYKEHVFIFAFDVWSTSGKVYGVQKYEVSNEYALGVTCALWRAGERVELNCHLSCE